MLYTIKQSRWFVVTALVLALAFAAAPMMGGLSVQAEGCSSAPRC
jgi:hypothetical protein